MKTVTRVARQKQPCRHMLMMDEIQEPQVLQLKTLRREQVVHRPLKHVFPFFERPENLALITPPSLDFRLMTTTPVRMEQGCIIDYTVRLLGVPVRWRSLIADYSPPHSFVDVQLKGPYAYWHHLHRFESMATGTRIVDRVQYALPAYLPQHLREKVHQWYVGPALRDIFDYRRDVVKRFFARSETMLTGPGCPNSRLPPTHFAEER